MLSEQERAFRKLSRLKVGALFMEQGAGKTKVALDLMANKASKVDMLLWICPCSLKGEIEAERLKWHPELKLTVIGCESISGSDRIYIETLSLVQGARTFIVVDESLKIKNIRAKRTKRIIKLGEGAAYKLILNGTPMSRNVLDIYPQMAFLSDKILKMSFNEFKDAYCEYYKTGRLKGKVRKSCNIPHLISIIQPYIFDASLDLDRQKNYREILYSIPDPYEYESIKADYLARFDDMDEHSFYGLLTRLQTCYCSYEGRREELEDAVRTAGGRAIIFVRYLSSIPPDAHSITGETKDRQAVIDAFRRQEFDVLYMTYGVGAFGLNLQFCNVIIFADHTFDYAQRIQAEARIFRIGQEHDVTYISLRCRCGLEDMIFRCLDKKQGMLSIMKEAIMKVKDKRDMQQLLASL